MRTHPDGRRAGRGVVAGVLATHRLRYGLAGLTVFGVVGVVAAATRPTATVGTVLPTLAAVAAAIIAMLTLIRAARESLPTSPPLDARPEADQAGRTAATSALAPSSGSPAPAPRPAAPPAGPIPGGAAAPGPPGGQPQLGRRRFLIVSGAAAGVAAVAGLGGRVLAERFSVASSLASLRLPAPAVPAPALPPGADLRIPGLSPFLTPNGAFYRVDTAIVLPHRLHPDPGPGAARAERRHQLPQRHGNPSARAGPASIIHHIWKQEKSCGPVASARPASPAPWPRARSRAPWR